MHRKYIIFLLLVSVFSCKKQKKLDENEAKTDVIMAGTVEDAAEFTSVVWTENGSKVRSIQEKPENLSIKGIHFIPRATGEPKVYFIGTVSGNIGLPRRIYMVSNGDRKELATLSQAPLTPSFSEVLINCETDEKGNTYAICDGYVYKIDPQGTVTYIRLDYGKLIFSSEGLKSVRLSSIIRDKEMMLLLNKSDGSSEEIKLPITGIIRCNEGATYTTEKEMFFFVILSDKITMKEITYLLTVDIQTKLFRLHKIGDTNKIINIVNSTLKNGLLYAAGDCYGVDPFYLEINVSDQSGTLKFTKVDLEKKPTLRVVRVIQIAIINNKVYVSAEYANKATLWINGNLHEVNNAYFYRTYPNILAGY